MAEKQPDANAGIYLQEVSVNEYQLRRDVAASLGIPTKLVERSADLELYRDDIGWERLGVGDTRDASPGNRAIAVKKSRVYTTYDSLCKQTVQLYTVYAVGTGIGWAVRDEPKGQEIIDAFTTSRANKRFFSGQGQREMSMRLLTDGEIFFPLFVGSDPAEIKVRTFDPLQIADIACDPEDEQTPLYYKRRFTKRGKDITLWYRDWNNEDGADAEDADGEKVTAAAAEKDIVVYHVKLDSIGKRGNPLLTSVFDMAKANRQFIRARLAIVMALAQFAWIWKVKGGQAAINSITSAMGSTLGDSNQETHPPAASGSTFVENEALTATPVKQETGAQSAQVDGAMLLQRFGSGVGIYPHYYGAGEAFRLATASAMELPMLKTFGAYTDLLVSVYADIFDYVLLQADIEDRFVDFDPPKILADDTGKLVHAIVEGTMAFPDLLQSDEVKKLLLMHLGVNNVDEVLEELGKKKEDMTPAEVDEALVRYVQGIGRQLVKLVEIRKNRGHAFAE